MKDKKNEKYITICNGPNFKEQRLVRLHNDKKVRLDVWTIISILTLEWLQVGAPQALQQLQWWPKYSMGYKLQSHYTYYIWKRIN